MQGAAAAILASVLWGVNPLFFSLLGHVPTVELLAHRIFWAAVFVGFFCVFTGRAPRLRAALLDSRARRGLMLTACLITVNWGVFLYAIQAGRVAEAGVGYYLMLLVAVGLGVFVLGEDLSRLQTAAIMLAALAVLLLGIGLGAAPWLPVTLAISFSFYGLLRKRMETGSIVGFEVEALLLMPFAAGWIGLIWAMGWSGSEASPGGWFGADLRTSLLLMLAGPFTGLPLILFAEAARQMKYSTASLIQYINPTLQVAGATLILGESVSMWFLVSLGIIWISLALYTREILRQEKASEIAASVSSTVSTTVR